MKNLDISENNEPAICLKFKTGRGSMVRLLDIIGSHYVVELIDGRGLKAYQCGTKDDALERYNGIVI